jgi:hypothetical protein
VNNLLAADGTPNADAADPRLVKVLQGRPTAAPSLPEPTHVSDAEGEVADEIRDHASAVASLVFAGLSQLQQFGQVEPSAQLSGRSVNRPS